jgi:hypothetical protein
MSLDTIQASYFGCAETPIWIPNDFNVNRVPDCKSCKLRLVSPVPGPGTVSPRIDGLLVDENPLSTLSVNGIQHNLVETILLIGGAHRLPARDAPCKAELTLYFQNTRDFSQHICLCLPVDVGSGAAVQYFATLGGVTSGRPVLSRIVPAAATYLMYRGADLRGRASNNNVPSRFCDPVSRVTTYYVCMTPIFMSSVDHARLVARGGKTVVGPPKPLTPVVNSRLVSYVTRVRGITIGAPGPVGESGAAGGPGYPTKALKCYRLDPNRDVVKDRVYVGGKGIPTDLRAELSNKSAREPEYEGIMPGDVQRWISSWVALGIAIVLGAFLFVLIFKLVFTNYEEAQHLYTNPLSAHAITQTIWPSGITLFPKGWFGGASQCVIPAAVAK